MEPRFIDPFTDTGFKIIFGSENQSNEILTAFLNDLFAGQPGFSPIVKLTYCNNERTRGSLEDRTIIYDVLCQSEDGRRFIVEMQRQSQARFLARSVYYVSRAIAEQGRREETALGEGWAYDVIPVVGVFFCNFFVRGLERKLVHHVRPCDTETGKPVGDLMRYAYIQLPAFDKTQQECRDDFDKWLFILKNMTTMQTIPFSSHRDVFERLARVANVSALNAEQRRQYDYDLKKARDYRAEMETAKEEGMAKGRAEGMAQGMAQGMARGMAQGMAQGIRATAKALLAKGVGVDVISSCTGLDEQQILAL